MKSSVLGIFGRAAGRSGYLARLFCLMSALALVAGCQDGRQNYLTTGIGTDLAAPDLARAESLQNRYFSYLCEQATFGSGRTGASCVIQDWSLIAYQGMNDIDRRCDSYLQWLDNRKRSKGPWISQIGDTAAAVSVILPVVGTGTKAITIVAQAFHLLTKSVENYHSRLLLEVESSTVNTIVLKSRQNFREYMRDNRVHIDNRPQAEHILRSYTRLCLPFAIEARINDFSSLGALGVSASEQDTFDSLPVAGQPFAADTPVNTNPGRKIREEAPGWSGVSTESSIIIDVPTAQAIQRALCFTGSAANGQYGPKTQAALRLFNAVYNRARRDPNWRDRTYKLNKAELNELRRLGAPGAADCRRGAKNYLERNLSDTSFVKVALKLGASGATTFDELRLEIRNFRQDRGFDNSPDDLFADQLTPEAIAILDPATR